MALDTAQRIKGYTGSSTVQGVGGAMTNGGITQNGVDYTYQAPKLAENAYGGGAYTKQGTIESSDPTSPYYRMPAPSVLSDANIREKVIPDIQNRANTLIGNSAVSLTNTQEKPKNDTNSALAEDDYSKIYQSILGGNSSESNPEMSLLDSMRSNIDQQFNSTVDSIKTQYSQLQSNLKKVQEESTQGLNNSFIRSGASRYSPFSTSGIMQAKMTSDINALGDLQAKENSLIAEAAATRQDKQYQLLDKQLGLIKAARTEKNALAQKITEDIIKKNTEIRKKQIQSSRDSAIAGILQQGITNPQQILGYLNFDDQGNQTGDFTAKEVEDTLKSLSPDNNLEKLSGTTRDFFILKGAGKLPANITSLPDDQQLFAYLAQEKRASSIINPRTGTKNVLTYKEVTDRHLPVSLVGMSEDEVYQSLYDTTPPAWFKEKLQTELSTGTNPDGTTVIGGMSVLPEVEQKKWNEYRTQVIANEKEEKKTNNFIKAKQYFTETYDGLTNDELEKIATQVETYVNGGMSYADAIEQTKNDLE